MKKLMMSALLYTCSASLAMASSISAVDSHSCQQLKGAVDPFILVLKKGENIHKSILQCANDAKLSGATLIGIGALERTTLNYFDHKTKAYKKKKFPQFLELLALNGNITQLNGKRVAHIHVALSDNNFHMIGGHLGDSFVGATAEIKITPLKGRLVKQKDKKTGLNLIATHQAIK